MFVLLATVWAYRVIGILAVSMIWATISATGVSGIVAFFFPKLGFRERIRQVVTLLRNRATCISLAIFYLGCGLMSLSGTTIIVLSMPNGVTQIQTEWGESNATSQDELKLNQLKWFWTMPPGTKVRFVSPGLKSETRHATPWTQLRFHGVDEFQRPAFVVVRIGSKLPPGVPKRDDEAGFQWFLKVTIRSVANPTAPATFWQPESSYYVGDPIWLGGDDLERPTRNDAPPGIEYDQIFMPRVSPCMLSRENNYTIQLLNQHEEVQFAIELPHDDVAKIRGPELREFVRQ